MLNIIKTIDLNNQLTKRITEIERKKEIKQNLINNILSNIEILLKNNFPLSYDIFLYSKNHLEYSSNKNNFKSLFYSLKEMNKIIKQLVNKQIPDKYDNEKLLSNYTCDIMTIRYILISLSSYGIVSNDWVKPLSELINKNGFKCLEIMSGSGILSYALQNNGVDIITTDAMKYGWNENKSLYTDVENLSAVEAIKKYGKDVDIIFMSWAPYDSYDGYKALKAKKKYAPKSLLIGIDEGCGGCVANDQFFERATNLCEEENYNKYPSMKRFEDIIHSIATDEIIIPQWSHIHDRLNCYK